VCDLASEAEGQSEEALKGKTHEAGGDQCERSISKIAPAVWRFTEVTTKNDKAKDLARRIAECREALREPPLREHSTRSRMSAASQTSEYLECIDAATDDEELAESTGLSRHCVAAEVPLFACHASFLAESRRMQVQPVCGANVLINIEDLDTLGLLDL